MVTTRRNDDELSAPRRPPAKTPDAAERRLVGMAYDLAEKQMREGTASAQVVSHFLKMGSSREFLEQERLEREVELLEKKKEVLASTERLEELMTTAISAFQSYSGNQSSRTYDD